MSEVISEGGDPVEEVVAPEGEATPEVEAPEAVAPEAPSYDPAELQAEMDYLRSQNSELFNILQQYSQQPATPQQAQAQGLELSTLTDEYGNLDPQKFAAYQEQRDQALLGRINEMFQPIQQTFQSQAEEAAYEQGIQQATDMLHDEISRNGEFATDAEADKIARERVLTRANLLVPEIAQRVGMNPRAAEMAVSQAAAEERAYLRSVGGAAVSQSQNQLSQLANAHGEPGAGGMGTEAPVIRMGETSAAKFGLQNG